MLTRAFLLYQFSPIQFRKNLRKSAILRKCLTCNCFSSRNFVFENSVFFVSAVRAGTGGDEAGIWAGDLVGRCKSSMI